MKKFGEAQRCPRGTEEVTVLSKANWNYLRFCLLKYFNEINHIIAVMISGILFYKMLEHQLQHLAGQIGADGGSCPPRGCRVLLP